ncbi:MAG: M12 family metallo-peptidase [Candidatus Azobacteroides sp.]|nr:M12 family metallo-peptidase [Candidatus Azobacteroides sp.]
MKYLLLIITLIIGWSSSIYGEISPIVTKNILSASEKQLLDTHFKKYKSFSIEKEKILNELDKKGQVEFRLTIDTENDWLIHIGVNDMRAENFTASYVSDAGTFTYQGEYIPNTYKGKTADDKIVRLTIDKNEFWGIILDGDEEYVIQQSSLYTKDKKDARLILYRNEDVIFDAEEQNLSISDILIAPKEISVDPSSQESITATALCNYYLQLATDADFEFYQKTGNNLTATYSYIFSILNLIEGAYESTFNLRFSVTYQNIWTTSNTPYNTTDASLLLDAFRTQWNSNHTGIIRNVAHLFTGKTLNAGTTGIAWLGQLNTALAYSLSMYRTGMFRTTAHEIGHNLNGNHPTTSACQCGQSTGSVMCQGDKDYNLWFCPESINQIAPFLASKSSLLTGNIPATLTLSGTVNGFNEYQAREKITSTQIIQSGVTIYRSNTIELKEGFEVKANAEFEFINDDNGCN